MDDYSINLYRDQLKKIKELKATGRMRDSDEAGEMMSRLSQSLRNYMEKKTGVAQPKLGRSPMYQATPATGRRDYVPNPPPKTKK